MTIKFNGITKDFVYATVETQRPMWATIERDFLTIPGRPGSYLRKTNVKARTIPVTFVIKGVDDMQKAKEEIADWLITDKPAPLVFPDEPDRTYYAVVDGDGIPDELFKFGKATINFVCPDPYKYGKESSIVISSTVDGINLVQNGDFMNGLTNWRTWQAGTTGNTRELKDITDFDGDDHKFTKGFTYTTVASEQYGYAQDNVALTTGEVYTLSAWFKVTSGTGIVLLQTGNATDGWTSTSYEAVPILGKWTKLTHTFTAKSGTTSIYVGQGKDSNGGYNSADVTGVQLIHGTTATKWQPFMTIPVYSDGTAPSSPIVECNFTAAASGYDVQLLNDDTSLNKGVSLAFDFIAGDKLVIDFSKRLATLNGERKNTAFLISSEFFQIPPMKKTMIRTTQPSTIRFYDKYK
ncbi:hypothetical protein FKN04_22350 [Bacillus glycinifermentans]|uniref:distal tail protein Dit n=1 Tax=Bacillus glycinifermentans TaxID=1664069 RepID=UPI0015832854|nr:distal tail protein Dit [Bacillus glycinifermentans]NUJ19277.1 hypothetical protein [Bacillus glycinifermentans]